MSHEEALYLGLKPLILAAVPGVTVVYGDLPSTPDRAVAVNVYAAVDEARVALSHLRVQLMIRGLPNVTIDASRVADPIFDALHGLEDQWFGSVHLVQCFRVSRVPLGIDAEKRSTRADNFECDVDLPLTAGRPF